MLKLDPSYYFIIIIKLFKGIHKRHVPVQGDTLTYNLYSYKNTITKQNNIHNISTELNNHIKINTVKKVGYNMVFPVAY